MSEMKIICANKDCPNKNSMKPVDIEPMLLLIGDSYKCPYCREYKFFLVAVKKVKNDN